jgi:AcrR family transcriptional regulator
LPRPKVPLISKRKTLEAALNIIDNEGLDSLSVRRLALELNVNAASLYHHFHNKEEILVGAAELALDEVRTPKTGDEHWTVWLMRNGDRLRRALVAHPDLIPIMMRRDLLGIGAAELNTTMALLEEQGVPLGAIAPMLEYGELLSIVCALAEHEHSLGSATPPAKYTHLRKAARNRSLRMGELYAVAYRAGMDALVATAGEAERARAPKKPKARKTAAIKKTSATSSRPRTARVGAASK